MKKIVIMIISVMFACISCGDKNSSENNSVTVSESVAETTEETTIVTELITEVPESVSDRDSGYDEIISLYTDCMKNNKLGNMMKLSYPDRYFDIFSFMAEMSGVTVGEVMGNMQNNMDNTIRITGIVSDEPFEDMDIITDVLIDNYGEFQVISNYIDEQGGKENIDEEKFNEFMDNAEYDSENITLYFSPEDVHIIKCNMESSVKPHDEDIEPEVTEYEQEFLVYYIGGEGWKMNTYSVYSD